MLLPEWEFEGGVGNFDKKQSAEPKRKRSLDKDDEGNDSASDGEERPDTGTPKGIHFNA